jgi:UDP-2,3-diacylglucosamine pyrophosphatase LpxH
MKINQPFLPARMNHPTELDLRAVHYIKSAIDSMFIITEITNNSPSIQRLYPTPITAMFCLYYGAMLLIAHGDNVLDDAQWLQKVESFQNLLKLCTNRWRIAGQYLQHVWIWVGLLTGGQRNI